MDFLHPVNAREEERKKRRKPRLKHLGIALLIFFGCVLLLILAAPAMLSTEPCLALLTAKVNRAIAPATVQAESVSFAWFREQELSGIRYTDPARGISAQIKAVRVSSLWKLLPLRKITATVTVDTPEILLSRPVPAALPLPGLGPQPSRSPDAAAEAAAEAGPWMLPAWNLAVNLTVERGRLTHDALPEPLLSDFTCSAVLPDISAEAVLSLNAKVPDGTLAAKVQLPPAGQLLTATRAADRFTSAELSLAADWATIAFKAAPLAERPYPGGSLDLTLACEPLLARLKQLGLRLPEKIDGLSGSLSLKGRLAAADRADALRLETELQARNLSGTVDGERLTFSPSLNLIAEFNPAAPLDGSVQRLSADLPGFMASASGSLRSGTLAAQADLKPLLETLQPLLGPVVLPVPVTLSLSGTATAETLKLSASARSGRRELAAFTLNGDGVNLSERSVSSLKTTLQSDLARLTPFLPLSEGHTLNGKLYLNTSASGSLKAWKAKSVLALHSVRFDSAAWHVDEAAFAEGSFVCSFTEAAGITCSDLTLTSPFGTAAGSLSAGHLALDGTLNPEKLLACRKHASGVKISGQPRWKVTATPGEPFTFAAELAADPLALTLASGAQFDLPVTLACSGERTPDGIELAACSLVSPCLTLEGKGTYSFSKAHLSASGLLTPDFGELWALPLFTPCREAGFALAGRHTNPFTLDLPLANGLAGMLNYGSGDATVSFDRITIPGLNIPSGEAKLTLRNAVAALDGSFSVNGGTVTLRPQLNLAETPMRLSLPENEALFRNITLSQDLLDVCLKRINPVLTGTVQPGGTLELTCNRCTLSLDDPIGSLDADLVFNTRKCAFTPTGNLNILINLLRLTSRTVAFPDQRFSILVEQGRLVCNPIALEIAPAKLQCSGTTDLTTGEIDYLVELPLTRQLLGRRLSAYFAADQLLTLPVSGTVHKPVLDTGPLLDLLRNSAIGAGVDKLSSRLGKILEKSGEAGLEVGGAAGDTIETGAEISTDTIQAVDRALKSLLKRKQTK